MDEYLAERLWRYAHRLINNYGAFVDNFDVRGGATASYLLVGRFIAEACHAALLGLIAIESEVELGDFDDLPESLIDLARQMDRSGVRKFAPHEAEQLAELEPLLAGLPRVAFVSEDQARSAMSSGHRMVQNLVGELGQKVLSSAA